MRNGTLFFALQINALVDKGHTESVEAIVDSMFKGEVVDYVIRKYGDKTDLTPFGESGPYSKQELNAKFEDISSYVSGNESRKYGITTNGLSLLVALAIEFLHNKQYDSEGR